MPYRSPVADILFSLNAVAGLPGRWSVGSRRGLRLGNGFVSRHRSGAFRDRGNRAVESAGRSRGRPLRKRRGDNGRRFAEYTGDGRKPDGPAYPRRSNSAAWACHISSMSPARKSGTARSMAFALCPLLTEGAVDALRRTVRGSSSKLISRPMVAGRWTGTMNLTEPQAGSDLNAVRSRAEPAEDGTLSPLRPEDLHHLWRARHGREHRPSRSRPASGSASRHARPLAVPRAKISRQPGRLARRPQRPSLRGRRAQARHPRVADLRHGLRRKRGRQGWLVGEENRGLAAMFVMMNAARLAVGTQGVAIGERAYQQALAYSRERRQGREPKGGEAMARSSNMPTCSAC